MFRLIRCALLLNFVFNVNLCQCLPIYDEITRDTILASYEGIAKQKIVDNLRSIQSRQNANRYYNRQALFAIDQKPYFTITYPNLGLHNDIVNYPIYHQYNIVVDDLLNNNYHPRFGRKLTERECLTAHGVYRDFAIESCIY
jgi:hypothetical protein